MKKIFALSALCVACILSLCACGDNPQGPPSADETVNKLTFEENIQSDYIAWSGRNVYEKDYAVVVCNNSAAGFEVSFEGSELKIEYASSNYPIGSATVAQGSLFVSITVDGANDYGNLKRLSKKTNATETTLVSGLKQGKHTVSVYKATEATCATWEIYSISCDGSFSLAPQDKLIKIEAYGDSLTAGLSVMREAGASDDTDSEYENALCAYPAVCAHELNAEYSAFCVSGSTVGSYESNQGGYIIPNLYERYTPNGSAQNAWNFNSYIPDIVLVDLGTNDIISCGGDDNFEERFKSQYTAFLGVLRVKYPEAKIVVSCGTFATFRKGTEYISVADYNDWFEDIVTAADDENIYCYTFTQTAQKGHPAQAEAQRYGEELAEFIKGIL